MNLKFSYVMYLIYISTFGKKIIRVGSSIPIEVGAKGRSNFKYSLRDDSGDNISDQNGYYGELTGLYWVWKNEIIADDDIVGYCHYNKALRISRKKATKWLSNHPNGFIVLKPDSQAIHEASDEVTATVNALKRNPQDYVAWCKHYDERAATRNPTCYGCNMFITTGKNFKEYCSWLFDILMEIRARVGEKPDVSPYLRRYCAFIGERLLTVYVEARNLPVFPVSKRIREWWIPLIYPIVQALHINRDSCFFKYFSKRMGSGSSYK